jgi:hypothetical protein
MAQLNLTFGSQTSRNSRSPEYHLGRKLSQLFDGPLYGSKWLAIYKLRLSELGRFAASRILGRPKLVLTNSAFRWLLIWYYLTNGFIATGF